MNSRQVIDLTSQRQLIDYNIRSLIKLFQSRDIPTVYLYLSPTSIDKNDAFKSFGCYRSLIYKKLVQKVKVSGRTKRHPQFLDNRV